MSTLDWNTQHIYDGAARPDPVIEAQTIPGLGAQRISPVSGVEIAIVAFVLYLATTARIPFISSVKEDNPGSFLVILRMIGYLISAALVLAFYRSNLKAVLRVLPITTLVVLCGVSTLWSVQPDTTRFQGVVLLGMTALGVYIGARFSNEEILRLVCITMAAVAFMSFIMLATDVGGLSLRSILSQTVTGAFVHKNLLGQSMSLGALAWLLFTLSTPSYWIFNRLILILTVLLLIFSNSMTSILAFAVLIAILPLLKYALSGSTRAVIMLGVIITTAPFITSTIDSWSTALLMEVGRDPSLTGRTGIWGFAIESISEKPTLGYGFAAFWQSPGISYLTERQFYWSPSTAHNGYLEIALSIGLIGLVLLVWALCVSVRDAFHFAKNHQDAVGLFPVAFLVFFMIYNASESIAGNQPNILWILFIAISVNMAKWKENSPGDVAPDHVSSITDDALLWAKHEYSR